MAKNKSRATIGITLGDAAGIGPEIVRAALDSGKLSPAFNYHILGDPPSRSTGHPSAETARAALEALEEAAKLALNDEIDAIVTGPIHKARMQAIGFPFPGQTEFFAARCAVENFAMLLTGGALTVALVTAHVPLNSVSSLLNEMEIVRVGQLLADFLQKRIAVPARIAVAGLNPHAGESGALGREEIEIIAPAVARLSAIRRGGGRDSWRPEGGRANPLSAIFTGPLSPDTVFNRAVNGEFDAVLCMYHDQGLIPLKLHAFDQGVNVTLGLPFVRTSPDHGTAFEIAGRGLARADSMIAAINLAAELAQNKAARDE